MAASSIPDDPRHHDSISRHKGPSRHKGSTRLDRTAAPRRKGPTRLHPQPKPRTSPRRSRQIQMYPHPFFSVVLNKTTTNQHYGVAAPLLDFIPTGIYGTRFMSWVCCRRKASKQDAGPRSNQMQRILLAFGIFCALAERRTRVVLQCHMCCKGLTTVSSL